MDFQHALHLFDEHVHHNVQHCQFELPYSTSSTGNLPASQKKGYHRRQSSQALQSFIAIGKVRHCWWLIGLDERECQVGREQNSKNIEESDWEWKTIGIIFGQKRRSKFSATTF